MFDFNIEQNQRLKDDYDAFFESAIAIIERVKKDNGNIAIENVESFRNVFKPGKGIRVTTIHGTKGEEYDTVIGFGLVNDWVPQFTDDNGDENSSKMLYVLCSRARKNLHLFSEKGRGVYSWAPNGKPPTSCLEKYEFEYDSLVVDRE